MEFGLAFSYVFKDPDWLKKIIFDSLIAIIPILGQLYLVGLGIAVARRVITNDPVTLPGVEFGDFLVKGLKAWVVAFVYAIPMILFWLPIGIVPWLLVMVTGDNGDSAGMIAGLGSLISVCCGGLAVLYGILVYFLIPAAWGNLAAKGGIGDGLRFGEVWGLVRKAPVAYLLVLVGGFIAGIIAPWGGILCGIGVFLTMTYANLLVAHLTGQAYREAIVKA